MKRPVFIQIAVVAAVGVMACIPGCSWKHHPKTNVLLVTLDTTRADHLGCYGYKQALTPVLDALAADGVLFEKAYCSTPLTLPSHATMLTGLLAPEHGLHINGEKKLDESIPTLAEALKTRGYATGAFIASFVLDSRFGLARGFDEYDDYIERENMNYEGLRAYRPGEKVVASALQWLSGQQDRPFFCWVHLFDPHKPYHRHEDRYGARFESPYDAEIAYMDEQIGRLQTFLDEQELSDTTLVILAGDHGEGLGQHDEQYHGSTLYDSNLHIPLIFVHPGRIPSAVRVPGNVSLADIYPTVLEYLDIGVEDTAAGMSLAAVLLDQQKPPVRRLYLETDEPFRQYGWCPLRGIIDGSWKYIRAPRPELYHLEEDPHEQEDRSSSEKEMLASLESQLQELEASMVLHEAATVSLSREDERVLGSLGYSGGGTPSEFAGSFADLPDGKDMLPLLQRARHAKSLLESDPKKALAIMREVAAKDSENITFQFLLAEALFRSGKIKETVDLLQTNLDQRHESMTPVAELDHFTLLGKCLAVLGQRDEAMVALRAALQIDPDAIITANGLAWLLATRANATAEDVREALQLAERVMELGGSGNPSYLDTLAAAHAANGEYAEAEQVALKAMAEAASQGDRQSAAEIGRRLEGYRRGRPYFE